MQECLHVITMHQGLALLTLPWDKNWDSHSLVNGYPSFYPRIALVAPSPGSLHTALWAGASVWKHGVSISTLRTHYAIITSLWRQNDVATSFWRHNDVIFASCARRVWLPCSVQTYIKIRWLRKKVSWDHSVNTPSQWEMAFYSAV